MTGRMIPFPPSTHENSAQFQQRQRFLDVEVRGELAERGGISAGERFIREDADRNGVAQLGAEGKLMCVRGAALRPVRRKVPCEHDSTIALKLTVDKDSTLSYNPFNANGDPP